MPVCTKCGVDRPVSRYCVRTSGKLRKDCKDCAIERSLKRYAIKKAEICEKVRLQNAANPEKNRARARAWAKANPERINERNKQQRKKYPERAIARWKVTNAVAGGRLVKKPCVDCGREPDRHVHGHHHNGYDEAHWYDVEWLCHWCHEKRHHSHV